MATRPNGDTLRWLDTLSREGSVIGLSDDQLLGRFVSSHGAGREAAFESIVRRHGPNVLALCLNVLRDDNDAEDAFQATFLVLARRASTIRDRDRLAAWLGRVSRRIALRARREAAYRQTIEGRPIYQEMREVPGADPVVIETAALVRAEVDRLPEADRQLMRLTYWQGKSYEEAAAALSWPIGTVRSRLSRLRDRLRGRLGRGGLAPALMTGGRANLVGEISSRRMSEALILRCVRMASRPADGISAAAEVGTCPAAVAALVNGELATMSIISWNSMTALLLLGVTVTSGLSALGPRSSVVGPRGAATPVAVSEPVTHNVRVASQNQAETGPLLENGGVEEGANNSPKAWTAGAAIPGVSYAWSRDEGHSGKASLRLKKTANRYFPIAHWSQKVDRKGERPRLRVSAWIKADRVTKAILDAQFIDGEDKWSHAWVAYIGAREPNDPAVSHKWKRYEGIVEIPAGTKQIVIAPQIYGPGTVWFDDLNAEYTDDPATDPFGT